MGLFEDIGKAVKSDNGIKALSAIVAAITAPNQDYKYTAAGTASVSAANSAKTRAENEQNKQLLKLKERELDIMEAKTDKKDKPDLGLPTVLKDSIDEEMKSINFKTPQDRARYRNALIASKYGAKKPKRTDILGKWSYNPKPDLIKGKAVYLGDTTVINGHKFIYVGKNNWEPIE